MSLAWNYVKLFEDNCHLNHINSSSTKIAYVSFKTFSPCQNVLHRPRSNHLPSPYTMVYSGHTMQHIDHISLKCSLENCMILPWPGGSIDWHIALCTKKVAVPILGQGTFLGCGFDPWSGCIWEATHSSVSLSLSVLPPFSLESVNISLGED